MQLNEIAQPTFSFCLVSVGRLTAADMMESVKIEVEFRILIGVEVQEVFWDPVSTLTGFQREPTSIQGMENGEDVQLRISP